MKTFDQIKDELSKEMGYENFSDRIIKGGFSGLPMVYDEAAKRYAVYLSEKYCRKQRRICFKNAKIDINKAIDDTFTFRIEPNSILHSPLATEILTTTSKIVE